MCGAKSINLRPESSAKIEASWGTYCAISRVVCVELSRGKFSWRDPGFSAVV